MACCMSVFWVCFSLSDVSLTSVPVEFMTHEDPKKKEKVLFFFTGHLTRTFKVQVWTDRNLSIYSEWKHSHITAEKQPVMWGELTRTGSSCQKLLEERKQNHLQPSMKWNVDNAYHVYVQSTHRAKSHSATHSGKKNQVPANSSLITLSPTNMTLHFKLCTACKPKAAFFLQILPIIFCEELLFIFRRPLPSYDEGHLTMESS